MDVQLQRRIEMMRKLLSLLLGLALVFSMTAASASGEVFVASADGFGGPVKVRVTFTEDGRIETLSVSEDGFQETKGMGARALIPEELEGFIGAQAPLSVEDVDALTGATVTKRAIVNAVNDAYAAAAERGYVVPATNGLRIHSPGDEFDLDVILNDSDNWEYEIAEDGVQISRKAEKAETLARIILTSTPTAGLSEIEKDPCTVCLDFIGDMTGQGPDGTSYWPVNAYAGEYAYGVMPDTGAVLKVVSWLAGDRIYLAAIYEMGEQADAEDVFLGLLDTFQLATGLSEPAGDNAVPDQASDSGSPELSGYTEKKLFSFRNGITFGMSEVEVIQAEGGESDMDKWERMKLNSTSHLIGPTARVKVGDYKADVIYYMTENQMEMAVYSFTDNSDKSVYRNINRGLISLYGPCKPVSSAEVAAFMDYISPGSCAEEDVSSAVKWEHDHVVIYQFGYQENGFEVLYTDPDWDYATGTILLSTEGL